MRQGIGWLIIAYKTGKALIKKLIISPLINASPKSLRNQVLVKMAGTMAIVMPLVYPTLLQSQVYPRCSKQLTRLLPLTCHQGINCN
jgi:hypothetical protein